MSTQTEEKELGHQEKNEVTVREHSGSDVVKERTAEILSDCEEDQGTMLLICCWLRLTLERRMSFISLKQRSRKTGHTIAPFRKMTCP